MFFLLSIWLLCTILCSILLYLILLLLLYWIVCFSLKKSFTLFCHLEFFCFEEIVIVVRKYRSKLIKIGSCSTAIRMKNKIKNIGWQSNFGSISMLFLGHNAQGDDIHCIVVAIRYLLFYLFFVCCIELKIFLV